MRGKPAGGTAFIVIASRAAAFAAAVAAACLVPGGAAHAQQEGRAIAAVIASPELVAQRSCTAYADSAFVDVVKIKAPPAFAASPDKVAAVRAWLGDYDRMLEAMCAEVATAFQAQREQVLDAYARQVPSAREDVRKLLSAPGGARWAAENEAFLVATATLVHLYRVAQQVAPDLLQPPAHGTMTDARTVEEVALSPGKIAKADRTLLMTLLSDPGFARLAPKRYDLDALYVEERRLRRDALRLRYANSFGWFNDNASDQVLQHFGSADVMREVGVAPIYERYRAGLEKTGTGH